MRATYMPMDGMSNADLRRRVIRLRRSLAAVLLQSLDLDSTVRASDLCNSTSRSKGAADCRSRPLQHPLASLQDSALGRGFLLLVRKKELHHR